MRLTSSMWFAAFMRKEQQRGSFVAVVKSGSEQAGAIFVVHNHLDGVLDVYSPAPQSMMMERAGRKFECVLKEVPQSKVDEYLEKQKKFDPDLWIVEVESSSHGLDLDFE